RAIDRYCAQQRMACVGGEAVAGKRLLGMRPVIDDACPPRKRPGRCAEADTRGNARTQRFVLCCRRRAPHPRGCAEQVELSRCAHGLLLRMTGGTVQLRCVMRPLLMRAAGAEVRW